MGREETWLRSFPSGAGGPFPSTQTQLLARITHGPETDRRAALGEFCRIYYKPVRRFFERALRVETSDLDDLVQEFWRSLIEDDFLGRFRGESSFRLFLKGVCRNKCKQWLERAATRRRIEGSAPPDAIDAAIEPDELDRSIDDSFRRFYVENALERTRSRLIVEGKERHYEILAAVIVPDDERPSYVALAERHGMTVTDVRNVLYHSRRLFRAELLAFAKERSEHPEEELRALGLEVDPTRGRAPRATDDDDQGGPPFDASMSAR